MSFSSAVKNELCRIELNERCCLVSELFSAVRVSGVIMLADGENGNIKLITENAAFARRIFSLIKRIYNTYPEVVIRKSKKLKKHTSYILGIVSSREVKELIDYLGAFSESESNNTELIKKLLRRNCCKKSFLRGAFLAGGSICDPEKTYHLEITTHSEGFAGTVCELINKFSLNAKVIKRKGNFIIYIKEGENIVDFLNIIGAHSALMELENIRILKEMRNNVNRIVNCETANLDKTITASLRQIENIKYIRDKMGFENLPKGLSEIAQLRLQYKDANLKELGEMLSPPLGKSGVNHRLQKLDRIAESTRNLKGEV